MIGTRATGVTPERRLLRYDRRARRQMAVAAGVGATMALVAQLFAIALAVSGVFLEGRTVHDVVLLLTIGLALLLGRTVLGITAELAARRSAQSLVGTLRADLTRQVLRLGPTWASHERSGEISGVLVGGLESIEEGHRSLSGRLSPRKTRIETRGNVARRCTLQLARVVAPTLERTVRYVSCVRDPQGGP